MCHYVWAVGTEPTIRKSYIRVIKMTFPFSPTMLKKVIPYIYAKIIKLQLHTKEMTYPGITIQQAPSYDCVQENFMSCNDVIQVLCLLDLVPEFIP